MVTFTANTHLVKIRQELDTILAKSRNNGDSIGFVPTMGALHEGHLSLIKASKQNNDLTISSIFVNPDQFNDSSDLQNYPRDLDNDLHLLNTASCDICFAPNVEEIYPEKDERIFSFDGLDSNMEGLHRPGHFNGVARVVFRLFDLVNPTKAYFGEKDFQQVAIISHMAKIEFPDIEIIACPTVRDSDGLAMSSRNRLLTDSDRKDALTLSFILNHVKENKSHFSPITAIDWVKSKVDSNPNLKLEYFNIVDPITLKEKSDWEDTESIACIAAYCDNIRLIDNIRI